MCGRLSLAVTETDIMRQLLYNGEFVKPNNLKEKNSYGENVL